MLNSPVTYYIHKADISSIQLDAGQSSLMQLACWFCRHVISLFFFSFFGICVKLDNSFSHSSRSDLVGATLCNFVQHESVFRCCGKVKQKAKTSSSQTSCTDTIKVKLHSSHLIYLHHRILPPLVAASDASIAVLAAAGIVVAADSVAVVGAALKKKTNENVRRES